MTGQKEFLGRLVKALDDSGIAYMLSGSMGSSLHGRPRATNDADIVIDPTQQQLTGFLDSLGPGYYVSRQTALDALKNKTMFNIIDVGSGWKADIIIVKDRAYSREEFARRKTATVMGMNLCVVSPEDCILSKLEWSKGRESQTQFKDASGVLMVQWDRLDFGYMEKWSDELNVRDSLEQLLKETREFKARTN